MHKKSRSGLPLAKQSLSENPDFVFALASEHVRTGVDKDVSLYATLQGI